MEVNISYKKKYIKYKRKYYNLEVNNIKNKIYGGESNTIIIRVWSLCQNYRTLG